MNLFTDIEMPEDPASYAFGCDRDCREWLKKDRTHRDIKIAITVEASRGAGRVRMPILRKLVSTLERREKTERQARIMKFIARRK